MVACELPHLPSIDACAKFDVGAAARHGGPTSPPTASTIDKSIKDAFTGKASDTKSTDKIPAKRKFEKHKKKVLHYESLLQKNPFCPNCSIAWLLSTLHVGMVRRMYLFLSASLAYVPISRTSDSIMSPL